MLLVTEWPLPQKQHLVGLNKQSQIPNKEVRKEKTALHPKKAKRVATRLLLERVTKRREIGTMTTF